MYYTCAGTFNYKRTMLASDDRYSRGYIIHICPIHFDILSQAGGLYYYIYIPPADASYMRSRQRCKR